MAIRMITNAGGVHDLVFSVVTSKPEITWHLDKSNLVVKVRDVARCNP